MKKVARLSSENPYLTSSSVPTGTDRVKVRAADETICKKGPTATAHVGVPMQPISRLLPDWTRTTLSMKLAGRRRRVTVRSDNPSMSSREPRLLLIRRHATRTWLYLHRYLSKPDPSIDQICSQAITEQGKEGNQSPWHLRAFDVFFRVDESKIHLEGHRCPYFGFLFLQNTSSSLHTVVGVSSPP